MTAPPSVPTPEVLANRNGWWLFAGAAGILVVVAFRVWLAATEVMICTWDDYDYRMLARADAATTSCFKLTVDLLLPDFRPLIRTPARSVPDGYHKLLVAGLKASDAVSDAAAERMFLIVNMALWLSQGVLVYLVSWMLLRNNAISLLIVATYLSSPFVFGISRWVLTENYSLFGSLVAEVALLSIVTAIPGPRLGDTKRFSKLQECLIVAAAALAVGMSAGVREYSLPLTFGASVAAVLILCLRARWILAAIFMITITPYLIGAYKSIDLLLPVIRSKLVIPEYYHSWIEWGFHSPSHILGGLLVGVPATLFVALYTLPRRRSRPGWDREDVAFFVCLALQMAVIAMAAVGLGLSSNRTARAWAVFLVPMLVGTLLTIRLVDRGSLSMAFLRPVWLVAFLINLVLLGFHVGFGSDAASRFTHHALNLEIYNYPTGLRKLANTSDMHIENGKYSIAQPRVHLAGGTKNFAKHYMLLRDWSLAEEMLVSATWLEPRDASGWFLLGICRIERERLAEALDAFRRARAIDPENREIDAVIQRLESHLAQ